MIPRDINSARCSDIYKSVTHVISSFTSEFKINSQVEFLPVLTMKDILEDQTYSTFNFAHTSISGMYLANKTHEFHPLFQGSRLLQSV